MVLPLRLIGLCASALALYACGPEGSSSEPDLDDGRASAADAGGELAPVEAEPEGPAPSSEGGEAKLAAAAPEQFAHAGATLGLWPADCLLIAESAGGRAEHHFEFPGECHFVTTKDGGPLVVETDTGLALMVESSKALDEGCDTALRVIVLSAEGPRLSRAVQRVQMCAPGGWDEMMFHVLASEPVVFGTPGGDP